MGVLIGMDGSIFIAFYNTSVAYIMGIHLPKARVHCGSVWRSVWIGAEGTPCAKATRVKQPEIAGRKHFSHHDWLQTPGVVD